MTWGKCLTISAVVAVLLATLAETPAHADARISSLADATFGTLNPSIDQSISDNVCAYSALSPNNPVGYAILATGTGGGGAFELASGPRTLAYEARWADSPNQTTGTLLTAGVLATGFANGALRANCQGQNQGTATLTVTLRAAQVSAATAGSYSGALTIMIVPQ